MPLFARAREEVQPDVPAPEPVFFDDSPAPGYSGLRSLEAHRDYLLSKVASLQPFGIGLRDAAGLTLCESIVADIDLPTFTAAAVDGWAVRASNLVGASQRRPVTLPVVDEIGAGAYRGAPLTAGTAVRVAADAPVPEGADAVVAVSETVVVGEDVRFTQGAYFRQNLRLAGSRISDGDQLLAMGTVLTPRGLGLIAEVGYDKVLARPRPRVVVITADSALVEPGFPLTRLSESYDASTDLLSATAKNDGAQVFPAGIVSTEPRQLATTLGEQLVRADLVLLVTEVTDDMQSVLGGIGQIDVAEVDALPGRQLFALVGVERIPLLVLPAGPVPAYLAYLLFGRPLVQRLFGVDPAGPTAVVAPVTQEVAADPVRTRLLLGHHTTRGVSPQPMARPGAAELADANAVIVVPPADEPIPAHGDVTCWLLD